MFIVGAEEVLEHLGFSYAVMNGCAIATVSNADGIWYLEHYPKVMVVNEQDPQKAIQIFIHEMN